jgi:hypothetical protein
LFSFAHLAGRDFFKQESSFFFKPLPLDVGRRKAFCGITTHLLRRRDNFFLPGQIFYELAGAFFNLHNAQK